MKGENVCQEIPTNWMKPREGEPLTARKVLDILEEAFGEDLASRKMEELMEDVEEE